MVKRKQVESRVYHECGAEMQESVVIFDIETTGLKHHDTITVICAIEQAISHPEVYKEHRFNVLETAKSSEAGLELCKEFLGLVNGASKLVAYNGLAFDIPFVVRWANSYGLVVDKYAWDLKTIDFYKIILRRTGIHFKMQKLCENNALEVSKSGTGLDAVQWAKEGNYEKLMLYCMQDVIVLRMLLLRACTQGLCVSIVREQNSAYENSTVVLKLAGKMENVVIEKENVGAQAESTRHSYQGVVDAVCEVCEHA